MCGIKDFLGLFKNKWRRVREKERGRGEDKRVCEVGIREGDV